MGNVERVTMMGIHLRSICDASGDVVEYAWYCSTGCYQEGLASDPPSPSFEEGGAYPCGAEHDSPDQCAWCGEPVGNPLTDAGVLYLRELLADWHGSLELRDSYRRVYERELSA